MTSPSRLDRFIASDPALEALAVEAERLKKLQRIFGSSVPQNLAVASRVAAIDRGTVVVFADNNAIAAKLNQLTARITLHLSCELPEVTGTRIEVQVMGSVDSRKPAGKRPPRSISAEEMASVKALHEKLTDSPLRYAVGKLLLRSKKP